MHICLDCPAELVYAGRGDWPLRCPICRKRKRAEAAARRYHEVQKHNQEYAEAARLRVAAWTRANPDRVRAQREGYRETAAAKHQEKRLAALQALGTRQCKRCSGPFAPKEPRQVFCTDRCRQDHFHDLEKARRLERDRSPRACGWCGASFHLEKRSNAVACSKKCRDALKNQRRKFARRAGVDESSPIVRWQIAERDGWRCQIPGCGKRIDSNRQHPDPWSLSIDHVIPVVEFAPGDPAANAPANLQAAHLRCNLRKKHRGPTQQLALFG